MKLLLKRVSLPLLLLVGLTLIGPQTAEAGRWRRYYGPPAVYAPPVRVYPPAVGFYVRPGVHVHAPGVGVHVGPGVHVYAPGVGVNIGGGYPYNYGGAYYFGW